MRATGSFAIGAAVLSVAGPSAAQGDFALSFGPDRYVEVAPSPSLGSITTGVTVEAWVRLAGTTSRPTVVRRNTTAAFGGPQIYILRVDDVFATTMELAFYVHGDAAFATVPLSIGAWHHFAGTFAGSEIRIYWDGAIVGTAVHAGGLFPTGGPLRIGIGETFEPWLGEIDEVRLWNFGRTQADLQAYMNSPLLGTEPGLVGYWRLDAGSGQVAADRTAFANHGTLGSTPGPDPNDPSWVTPGAPVGVMVSSLSDPAGPFYASTPTTIEGSGFLVGSGTSVTVGGLPAPSTVLGPTAILATIPPGPVGPADVTVTTASGSGTLPGGWRWQDHLDAGVASVSVADPVPVPLEILAEPANALRIHVLLASGSGTSPGCPLPGTPFTLPLHCDVWTDLSLFLANSPLFAGFIGVLDAQGEGAATFDPTSVPIPPSAVGIEVSLAYAVLQPFVAWTFVSNAVTVSFAP